MILPELLVFNIHMYKIEQKTRFTIIGASNTKAGLSHTGAIICIPMYYYALLSSWIVKNVFFPSFSLNQHWKVHVYNAL